MRHAICGRWRSIKSSSRRWAIRAAPQTDYAAPSKPFRTDSSDKCIRFTSGQTARSGRRQWTAHSEKILFLPPWIGIFGLDQLRCGRMWAAMIQKAHDGVYEPFNWRGWQDFGCGALGDMACHTVNMPFRALNLGDPTEVEAMPFGRMNKESFPVGSKIRFDFPEARRPHSPRTSALPPSFPKDRARSGDTVVV